MVPVSTKVEEAKKVDQAAGAVMAVAADSTEVLVNRLSEEPSFVKGFVVASWIGPGYGRTKDGHNMGVYG